MRGAPHPHRRRRLFALGLTLLAAAGCGRKEEAPLSLLLRREQADPVSSNQFLQVTASGDWTLSLSFEGAVAVSSAVSLFSGLALVLILGVLKFLMMTSSP